MIGLGLDLPQSSHSTHFIEVAARFAIFFHGLARGLLQNL